MNSIGVIGTGFVGTALIEGMRHVFDVYSYDKKDMYRIEYDEEYKCPRCFH